MKTNKFNGSILKKLRTGRKLTWLQLAKNLRIYEPKVSKNSVWGWENGNHQPSMRYLSVLSKYFNVSIESFLKK